MKLSRRKFISSTSLITAGAVLSNSIPAIFHTRPSVIMPPSERIGVGVIGCRGQGWNNLMSLMKIPGVECRGICDIDTGVLEQRKSEILKTGQNPKLYSDYRSMLDNKEIDVVIIATPDHWHCLQLIDACAAGKHVFLEKPVSNSIREAEVMVTAVNESNRVVQVAQWQRSMEHFQKAIAFVHSGQLGRIHSTKAWMFRGGTVSLPVRENEAVPAGVDYVKWLGPAEKRPFNKNRFHYEFRWFWDYAGGLMTDWGVHLIDMVLLGMKATLPKKIISGGGKFIFPDDARETPDLFTALYHFDHFQMTWEHNMGTGVGNYGMQHGIAFIGENGTLLLNRSGWEVRADKIKNVAKMEAVSWQPSTDNGLDKHTANFIEAVRSGKKEILNCPIEAGARVAVVSHMGNIAYRTGEATEYDAVKNSFGSKKANRLIKPEYHNGYKFPDKEPYPLR